MPSFTLSNRALNALASAEMPLTGTFYGQLMGSTYAFDPDTHDTIAAVTGELSPMTGYQTGGKPVTLTNAMSGTINTLTIAPVSWSANIANARSILIYYRPTGSIASQQIILGCNDFESNQSHDNGLFRVEQMTIQTAQEAGGLITIPNAIINGIINETINLSATNYYVMLLWVGYTRNPAHAFRSSLTASEITGTGYTAGGVPATITVTRNDVGNVTTLTANQVVHPICTITGVRYAAYYQRLGGAASADPIVMIAEYNTGYSSNNAVFPINPNTIDIGAIYS